jgi:hypothetical protein
MFAVVLALASFAPCQASSDSATVNDWKALARQYVLADQKLLELEEKKLEGIPQQLDLRDDLRSSLAKLPSPTIDQLKLLLGSSDSLNRKTALIAVFFKKVTDSGIIRTTLNNFRKEDDFFVRFYSHQALMNLSDSQLRTVQADVSRIIATEKYETLQVTSLPTLLRLQRDVAVPIFVMYFKKGSPGLKRAVYATLRSSGRSDDLGKIKATLKIDKDTSAIEFLNDLEKS